MKISSILSQNKIIQNIFAVAFWLIIWQIVANYVNHTLLLPTPIETFIRLFELIITSDFWISIFNSLLSILNGLLLGILLAIILAILCAFFQLLHVIISPFISIIRAVPVACFIILCNLFINTEHLSMFICFLMVVPIIFHAVYSGIKNTDSNLLEMAFVFKLSNFKKIKYIYIPSVLPYFISACKNAIGFAWKAGIATEILARPTDTIGAYIYESKILIMTTDLFAWTITIIIVSILTEKLTLKLAKKYLNVNEGN